MAKKTKVKNPRVERTRNGGTMTEAMFWSWMRSNLRKMSMYWKPISQAKNASRKIVYGKRHTFEYLCSNCGKWFKGNGVDVDHKIEAGSLKNFNDLPSFVERLFTEDLESLAVMCKPCHKDKTAKYKLLSKK